MSCLEKNEKNEIFSLRKKKRKKEKRGLQSFLSTPYSLFSIPYSLFPSPPPSIYLKITNKKLPLSFPFFSLLPPFLIFYSISSKIVIISVKAGRGVGSAFQHWGIKVAKGDSESMFGRKLVFTILSMTCCCYCCGCCW